MRIWHNGDFYEDTESAVSATSAGLTVGWGVFTTIGIFSGRPFALERHLTRLRQSAVAADIVLEFDDSTVTTALLSLLQRNAVHDGFARLTLTRRADGRWNTAPGSDLTIFTASRSPMPLNGLRVMLSSYRIDARRPTVGLKTTSHLDYLWISREAQACGMDEAIFCNSQGMLCEGARSNLFWGRGGELFTPALSSGCLPGIARALVCEWAWRNERIVHEGAFSTQELVAADEVFVTTATTGPRGVEAFYDGVHDDSQEHAFPSPGAITQVLQEHWQSEVLKECNTAP